MNQEAYHKLISGERACRCPCVGLGLSFAALGYALVIRLRNFLYDKGWLKAHKVNAKVISIGNVTVGGTGKTPLVVWLCNTISQKSKVKSQKCGCVILTRGYKARRAWCVMRGAKRKKWIPASAGMTERDTQYAIRNTEADEPAILAESCPKTKVIVNPDRVAGAVEAITKFGAKILVMDDGFQHRRLHRDLDIVTIDATLPFGYGKLLPAGLLREPITSLKRADVIVITRCNQISEFKLTELEEKLRQVNPNMIIAKSIHRPVCVKYSEHFVIPAEAGIHKANEVMDSCLHRNDSPEQLKGRKIFAFCGIGNPQSFLGTIKNTGAELVGWKIYDDHHQYSPDDLTYIYEQAKDVKADLILTTQKDWTKIPASELVKKNIPVAYLAIELKFIGGEDKIRNLIEKVLAGKISRK